MQKILITLLFCLTFSVCAFSQNVEQIDEFSRVGCDDYLARMDNLVIQAQENPNATIYIFVYEGKEKHYTGKSVNPARGSAKARIESMKKYFQNVRKVSIDNVKFVAAGFRENSTVAFWLVPNGAEPPKPTPTLTKMKYRKGKARGFCLYCCG